MSLGPSEERIPYMLQEYLRQGYTANEPRLLRLLIKELAEAVVSQRHVIDSLQARIDALEDNKQHQAKLSFQRGLEGLKTQPQWGGDM